MPNYPTPDENPACQCKGNPMRAMFCPYGHMLECHFPFTCITAGCSHLAKYDFEPEEVKMLDSEARANITAGRMPPYELDDQGNIIVKEGTP